MAFTVERSADGFIEASEIIWKDIYSLNGLHKDLSIFNFPMKKMQ